MLPHRAEGSNQFRQFRLSPCVALTMSSNMECQWRGTPRTCAAVEGDREELCGKRKVQTPIKATKRILPITND
jgi:hypothetical protein